MPSKETNATEREKCFAYLTQLISKFQNETAHLYNNYRAQKRRNLFSSQPKTAVKKTTFFLVLVDGTAFAPNFISGLIASRWLMRHWTPIVFLSCEIQTTLPKLAHSGHFLDSPRLTINHFSRFRYLLFARLVEFIFCGCSAVCIQIFFPFSFGYLKRISDPTG